MRALVLGYDRDRHGGVDTDGVGMPSVVRTATLAERGLAELQGQACDKHAWPNLIGNVDAFMRPYVSYVSIINEFNTYVSFVVFFKIRCVGQMAF